MRHYVSVCVPDVSISFRCFLYFPFCSPHVFLIHPYCLLSFLCFPQVSWFLNNFKCLSIFYFSVLFIMLRRFYTYSLCLMCVNYVSLSFFYYMSSCFLYVSLFFLVLSCFPYVFLIFFSLCFPYGSLLFYVFRIYRRWHPPEPSFLPQNLPLSA